MVAGIDSTRQACGAACARARAALAALPGHARRTGLAISGAVLALVVLASAILVAAPSEAPTSTLPTASLAAQVATPTISLGPTATPHASPRPSGTPEATPQPTPAPAATLQPGAKRPKTTLRVNCTNYTIHGEAAVSAGVSAVNGDRIYLICTAQWDFRLAAVNASTGHIARWYKLSGEDSLGEPFIYDQGFWYSNSSMDIMCIDHCPIANPWVARADPNTGNQTLKIEGWHLFGDGLGYVWAAPAVSAHASTLLLDFGA